ncbi:MAG TPA: YdcH family protein [Terriglobales bacterium]|nr:YdcH family protein [Terriglobales bacterium]
MNEQELKDTLARENEDFRKILEEHRSCEISLERIRKKLHPTEADDVAEREIKKRKLALKDRMYRIMADFEASR